MSFQEVNALVRQYERIRHCSSDLEAILVCQVFATHNSWLLSQSNFGPRKHDFTYKSCQPKKPAPGSGPIEKDLARISHLREDTQEQVLLCLMSSVTYQSPIKYYSTKDVHPFLNIRKRSAPINTKAPARPPALKQHSPLKEGQLQSLALKEKLLFSKDNTPKFSTLFPSTDLPHVTLLNGLPKIDKATFNALLLSRIRAIKSAVRNAGHICPKQLPRFIIRAVSHMIDRSLKSEVSFRIETKQKELQSKASQKKSKSKKPKSQDNKATLSDRFVPSKQDPHQDMPRTPSPPPSRSTLAPPLPSPTHLVRPLGLDFTHLVPDDVMHSIRHLVFQLRAGDLDIPVIFTSQIQNDTYDAISQFGSIIRSLLPKQPGYALPNSRSDYQVRQQHPVLSVTWIYVDAESHLDQYYKCMVTTKLGSFPLRSYVSLFKEHELPTIPLDSWNLPYFTDLASTGTFFPSTARIARFDPNVPKVVDYYARPDRSPSPPLF